MKKLFFFLTFLFFLAATTSYAQKFVYDINRTEYHDDMLFESVRRIIRLPVVNGLLSVKCDFHIHTVFSDGDAWPTARVKEAWQDGLDAIAITDHTSAAPSKRNVTGGPNASYEIAKPEADRRGLLLIQGTEITRSKEEGGHLNAIFITDAEKTLDVPTEDAVRAAVKQGAYIIWNHPGWAIDTCMMFDVNRRLIETGDIHAVEVFNEAEWYPRALSWSRDLKLAPTAATDIHYLTNSFYRLSGDVIRPMTIVLAREKTQEAIKQALFERRTIAFYHGMLAGDARLMTDFFFASVQIKKISTTYDRDRNATYHYLLSNPYDVPYVIQLESNPKKITLHPNSEVSFSLPAEIKEVKANLLNLHTYEYETLWVAIRLPE
ncbi:MAG: PHP domain-containing protein [Tannerella sp.]|jgi:hypothetical protein|nr:PHP domain-containing protein [Tannerella sp.]